MPQLHRALLRCFSGRTSHLIRPYRPAIWGCAGPGPVCQLPALQPPLAGKLRGTPPTAARRAPATVGVGGGELVQLKNKQNKTTRKPSFLENNLEEGVLNFVSVISVFIQPNLTSVQCSLKRSETNSALPQCLDGKSFKVVISAIVCS